MSTPTTSRTARSRGNARFLVTTVLVLGLLAVALWMGFFRGGGSGGTDVPLTEALARGPLRVTVMESGNLESLRSHKIVNQIEGRTTIDYIVEEGRFVTPEDVANGLVLVRLNSSDLEQSRVQQEIEVAAARDAHASAQTSLDIQLQQNASDMRKAELDVRFALLDLERYVGKAFAGKLLAAADGMAGDVEGGDGDGGEERRAAEVGKDELRQSLRRLISGLLESEGLEGEALQRIRTLTSDIRLAEEVLRRAEEKVRQSERLEGKGYYSRQDLEADKLALERGEIEVERTKTAREQYVTYDFPKEVEQLLSNVVEARDQRSRAAKRADAEEAQKRSAVEARLKQWELKRRRLESYVEQEKATVIRATKPGLIVYSSSNSGHWGRNDERIDEGSSVRQGQTLITIPDGDSLGVVIKVHETAIDKVREGLDAWVEVDALPGSRFRARVEEVNRMPDAADRWLNPDLKVYTTKIQLLEFDPGLKPGMSAQVEILVTTLSDVFSAPVQCVAGAADKPLVYVWDGEEGVRREVELGMASEHRVEIKSGVKAGERLLLAPPREKIDRKGGQTPAEASEDDGTPPAEAESAPAPARKAPPGMPPPGASPGDGRAPPAPAGGAPRRGKRPARPEGSADAGR